MYFKQIRRNAARNRKGNGLFFGSLVIAIIAFYTLLSLGGQDVMRYLATVESDAVGKLMQMLPIVYAVSLFFVFFLVYFACRYQTDSRRREFGLYLMLGMKRSRLFLLLLGETLWSSLTSLLIGVPAALFLTEGISLATANLVGLGIIGHRFSFSAPALFWTVCGTAAVQFLAMLVIGIGLGRKEPADFFHSAAAEKQKEASAAGSTGFFAAGMGLLFTAYYLGIFQLRSLNPLVLLAVLVCGIVGTFWLFRGLGGLLGRRIRRKSPAAVGLWTFTARQVQEQVWSQHKALAVASLLLLLSLACISYGISMGLGRSAGSRSVDFSLFGEAQEMEAALEDDGVRKLVGQSYPMYLSMVKEPYYSGGEQEFDTSELLHALAAVEDTENIIENFHLEYVIAESSYNELLQSIGREGIDLSGGTVALYSSMANEGDFGRQLSAALQNRATLGIAGEEYELLPVLYDENVVADRAITLYLALIVPDELYRELAAEPQAYCRNLRLKDAAVEELGLLQAVLQLDEKFSHRGLAYDSYLGGIGRKLFYTVAASYLTIYLGLLFWLIANTVIGLKYLIGQRRTRHRYETLAMLGADAPSMGRSVKKQISMYFSLVLCVALISSAAALGTMFTSFTRLPAGVSARTVWVLSAVALSVFALIELLYIGVVKRMAGREMRRLDVTNRR